MNEPRYGLPELPIAAYVQRHGEHWGVWIETIPFHTSLALHCTSEEEAIKAAQKEWREWLEFRPDVARLFPVESSLEREV